MSLFVQFQCCFFSFVCGFVMLSVYHLFHRLMMRMPFIIRMVFHFLIGILISFVFYSGLVYFNYGVLNIYEFIFLGLGYLVYQKYYAYYELILLEKLIRIMKKIISPFIFFLKKINVIMRLRVRKVMGKWRKEDQHGKS